MEKVQFKNFVLGILLLLFFLVCKQEFSYIFSNSSSVLSSTPAFSSVLLPQSLPNKLTEDHQIESHLSSVKEKERLRKIREILRIRSHYKNHRCGRFKDEYLSQYARLQAQSQSQKKFLIAIPNLSGLADRILGLASVFAYSLLTERIFLIGQRQPLLPIETFFTSPYFNWSRFYYDPDWVISLLTDVAEVTNFNETILRQGQYYAVNIVRNESILDALLNPDTINQTLGGNSQTTFIVSNRGRLIRMFSIPQYRKRFLSAGLTPYTITGCLIEFLLAPKPFIFLPVYSEMLQLHSLHSLKSKKSLQHTTNSSSTIIIAIQIRTGDTSMFHNDTHSVKNYTAFFACAKQIEEFALTKGNQPGDGTVYREAKWYLVTDSMSLRKDAVRVYGSNKIITSINVTIEHSAKEHNVCPKGFNCDVSAIGMATAAAEWWLMSYARYHVITGLSGFGRSAGVHSLQQNSIYTIFDKQDPHVNCSANSFTALDKIASEWSGI